MAKRKYTSATFTVDAADTTLSDILTATPTTEAQNSEFQGVKLHRANLHNIVLMVPVADPTDAADTTVVALKTLSGYAGSGVAAALVLAGIDLDEEYSEVRIHRVITEPSSDEIGAPYVGIIECNAVSVTPDASDVRTLAAKA